MHMVKRLRYQEDGQPLPVVDVGESRGRPSQGSPDRGSPDRGRAADSAMYYFMRDKKIERVAPLMTSPHHARHDSVSSIYVLSGVQGQ